jgi:hypothetical protein
VQETLEAALVAARAGPAKFGALCEILKWALSHTKIELCSSCIVYVIIYYIYQEAYIFNSTAFAFI